MPFPLRHGRLPRAASAQHLSLHRAISSDERPSVWDRICRMSRLSRRYVQPRYTRRDMQRLMTEDACKILHIGYDVYF